MRRAPCRSRHRRGYGGQPRGQARRCVRRDRRQQGRRAALRRRRRLPPARPRSSPNRPPEAPLPDDVAFVRVHNARRALALIAAKFLSAPAARPSPPSPAPAARPRSRLSRARSGARSAIAPRASAPIGVVSPSGETYGSLTTPDPVALHRSLDALAGEGVTHLAIEASSHGLDQYRLDGLRIAAGGFTNITRDHLDYHPTFEAYFAAKMRLFEDLLAPGGGGGHRCRSRACRRGGRRGHSARPLDHDASGATAREFVSFDAAIDGFAQTLRLEHAGKNFHVRLPLVGEFQVENALVAAGLAIATGGDAGRGVRGARRSVRRQGPARARRHQAAARRSSSTTRTSPTRSPRRSRRCGPM